jgi:hypothetical protein
MSTFTSAAKSASEATKREYPANLIVYENGHVETERGSPKPTFDINKLSFGTPYENDKGGRSISIHYKELNDEGVSTVYNLLFRGPTKQRLPFGVQETEDKKFKLRVEMKRDTPFTQTVQGLDAKIKTSCKENSLAWFKKKSISDTELALYQNLSVKEKLDKEGEVDEKYEPLLSVNLPFWPDRRRKFKLYDEEKKMYSNDLLITEILSANSTFEGLYHAKSIWIVGSKFGVTFELNQGQVLSQKKSISSTFLLDTETTTEIDNDNILVVPSEFDPSQLRFESSMDLEKGGKVIPLKYAGKTLVLKTTLMRIPFDANCFVEADGTKKKYTLTLKTQPDAFTDSIVALDTFARSAFKEKPMDFGMKKKTITEEEVAVLFKSSLREHKKDGEVTGKYPPTFIVKLPMYDGVKRFAVFDASKKRCDNSSPDISQVLKKQSDFTGLVKVKGIFAIGTNISFSYELLQGQVLPNGGSLLNGFALDRTASSSFAGGNIHEDVAKEVENEVNALVRSKSVSAAAMVDDSDEEIEVEEE